MKIPKQLFIELADTHEKREYGLMNRKYLPHNQGMLFKFHNPILASFWMQNTYIPLDIAFIDDKGKILQIESMVPLSTKPVYSQKPCKYALEVNKGWFSKNNITIGSKIDGDGIGTHKITSQFGGETRSPEVIPGQPKSSQSPPPLSPDIQLNLSFKERLKKADLKGKDIIIIYRTKEGTLLPPKTISPPFEFEKDAEGHHDSIVKAWDNQTGGWKSFIIDNIVSLEEKEGDL